MKRFIAIVVVAFLVCFASYEFASVAVCDGWYDLTVEIDPDTSSDLVSVAYMPANSGRMSDAIIASVDEQLRFMEHPDTVDTFTVSVGFSYRVSKLGRTWGHVQEYSHIVVVLTRADGSNSVHRLMVPHRDDSRRVVITAASNA